MAAFQKSPAVWIYTLILVAVPYSSGHVLDNHHLDQKNCINMTLQAQAQIKYIADKLAQFFEDISKEYEQFDITNVKLDIERHRDDETPAEEAEKDLQIVINVNDCKPCTDKTSCKRKVVQKNKKGEDDVSGGDNNIIEKADDEDTSAEETTAIGVSEKSKRPRPVLYNLMLDEEGQRLLKFLQKDAKKKEKKPIVAYIQPKVEYLFFQK